MSENVVIALGSNDGERVANLDEAVRQLRQLFDGALLVSDWFVSQPVGMADASGEFLNGVMAGISSLAPEALLAKMQEIEVALGRPPEHGKHVSRTIDLDMIAYGNLQQTSRNLILPHPRARERLFVLEPLAEILPGYRFPGDDVSVEVLIRRLQRAVDATSI